MASNFCINFWISFFPIFSDFGWILLKNNNVYVSEEENTLNWVDIQSAFQKTFGSEIYNSWLQKISLIKEYNDFLILGVPTRFFRDWIVSRYLDKILEQVKNFKLSLNRIEFKIIDTFYLSVDIFN